MSAFAILDNKNVGQIATNSGYIAYGHWVDKLKPMSTFIEMHYLRNKGLCLFLEDLEPELVAAMKKTKNEDIKSVGEALLKAIRKRKNNQSMLVVTLE